MIHSVTPALARAFLPPRREGEGKWAFGRALLVCGSARMTGAALLSAGGALRSGAGLVQLAAPEEALAPVRVRFPEGLFLPLPRDAKGCISGDAAPLILAQAKQARSLLFGCGVGISNGGRQVLRAILQDCPCGLALDADGLNLLAEEPALLRRGDGPKVLTPHVREFCRLSGQDRGSPPEQLWEAAAGFARRYGAVLVLKGASTLVTDGDRSFSLDAPNSGLAKGGSGDLLAGIVAGLLAQQPQLPLESAVLAVWLHSRAGALAREGLGRRAMLPQDVMDRLGRAFAELEEDPQP